MGFSIVNKLKAFVFKINDTQLGENGIDTGKIHEKVMVTVNYVEKNTIVSENK